jgi:hypothetical protein
MDSFYSSTEDGLVLDNDPSVQQRMVTIDPKNFIGRNFLKDPEEDGQCFRARVICALLDNKDKI